MRNIGGRIRNEPYGRCERCGRLMVIVRVPHGANRSGPEHLMGWKCLICGKMVDLHTLGHRHEPFFAESHRRFQPQAVGVGHV